MNDEVNLTRCQDLRGIIKKTQEEIRRGAKRASNLTRETNRLKDGLRDKKRRLKDARRREVEGIGMGLLPGGPISGMASTAITVAAALAIAKLEPEIAALENRIFQNKHTLVSLQEAHDRYEANLASSSREANQLRCSI